MAQTLRMDGYIRVSRRMGRDGPGYISPKVQQDAIQKWADYRNIEIAMWHIDEDESGGTQNRPGLRACMARIEAHETDGIACWRLNRFARNVAGAMTDIKRVQDAGGQVVFVEEDIDTTGPFGSFILTVLLAVSTLERDNLVAGWKTAKTRATDRGVKIGPTPYGYRRKQDGQLEPHPEHAHHVQAAFSLAATKGLEMAYQYLLDHAEGRTWTHTTVRRLLSKRSYLGEAHYGDLINLQAHEPLIDPVTWEAAQPEGPVRRRPKEHFPLSGLLTCETCGSPLVGSRGGREARRMYRCSSRECPAPVSVTAELIEHESREYLADLVKDHPGFAASETTQTDIDRLRDELDKAETALLEFAQDVELHEALGPVATRMGAESRMRTAEAARMAFREASRSLSASQVVVTEELVREASLSELGELLRGAMKSIVIEKGRTPLRGRLRFVLKGSPSES